VSEPSLPDLARQITSGAVRLAAATAAWLRLVAEFDRREGWHGVGVLMGNRDLERRLAAEARGESGLAA
jgi:hypothetical protein